MTTTSGVLLVALAVAAVANWISRSRPNGRMETITKPLVTLLVIALAAVLRTSFPATRGWVLAGLVACLIGDVLLLPIIDNFVGGLGAFLIGHVLFGVAVLSRPHGHWVWAMLAVVPVALIVGRFGPPIVSGARTKAPALGIAVAAYLVVIASMALMVALTGSQIAMVGAALFVVSDTLLGFDLFSRSVSWARVGIMITYHLALVGLTLGLLWQ